MFNLCVVFVVIYLAFLGQEFGFNAYKVGEHTKLPKRETVWEGTKSQERKYNPEKYLICVLLNSFTVQIP